MKKITEWAEDLPEPIRSQYLANFHREGDEDIQTEGLLEALHGAFYWEQSPEGAKYWHKVAAELKKKEKLLK